MILLIPSCVYEPVSQVSGLFAKTVWMHNLYKFNGKGYLGSVKSLMEKWKEEMHIISWGIWLAGNFRNFGTKRNAYYLLYS